MSEGFQRPLPVLGSVFPGGLLCRKTVKVGGGRSLGGARNVALPPAEDGVGTADVGAVTRCRFITRVADARTEREEEKPKRGRKVAEKEAQEYQLADPEELIKMLEGQMRDAATALDFEAAARLRDQLFEVKARMAGAPVRGTVAADAKVGSRR